MSVNSVCDEYWKEEVEGRVTGCNRLSKAAGDAFLDKKIQRLLKFQVRDHVVVHLGLNIL